MVVAATGGNAGCAGRAARPAASGTIAGWRRPSGRAHWRTTLRAWACGRPNGWWGQPQRRDELGAGGGGGQSVGVDSSLKCDNSEEVALRTFLFRRKPLLPVG